MELGNVEAIKVLVSSGLGASILPKLALSEDVPGAVLRPLRPAVQRYLGLALRREKIVDRGLRLLLDQITRLHDTA
jgi:DNA-binding transcriptional LysR family regulator